MVKSRYVSVVAFPTIFLLTIIRQLKRKGVNTKNAYYKQQFVFCFVFFLSLRYDDNKLDFIRIPCFREPFSAVILCTLIARTQILSDTKWIKFI